MYGILDKMVVEKGAGDLLLLQKALERRVARLDGLFAAVAGLAAHQGLSPETWDSILERTCPTFDDPNVNYSVAGYFVPID
jgi:hypothetical protein